MHHARVLRVEDIHVPVPARVARHHGRVLLSAGRVRLREAREGQRDRSKRRRATGPGRPDWPAGQGRGSAARFAAGRRPKDAAGRSLTAASGTDVALNGKRVVGGPDYTDTRRTVRNRRDRTATCCGRHYRRVFGTTRDAFSRRADRGRAVSSVPRTVFTVDDLNFSATDKTHGVALAPTPPPMAVTNRAG